MQITGEAREWRVKPVNRQQLVMKTVDVEELVGPDHPARSLWELVARQDLSRFYEPIRAVEGGVGRSAWDPHMLICLWVYAYSDGVSSAREIERLCQYKPAYQWLSGLQVVNYHTLSDFRVSHGEPLRELFIQVLGVLTKEGLITLERVMHDGTKIKANASRSSFRREHGLQKHLEQAREQVKHLEASSEQPVNRRLQEAQKRAAADRQHRLEQAIEELEKVRQKKSGKEKEQARASSSDPEARNMRHADGGFSPSYNLQLSTDAVSKMIVGVGISQNSSDFEELQPAVEELKSTAGHAPQQMVVDGGYVSGENIVQLSREQIVMIAPLPDNEGRTAGLGKSQKANYAAEQFTYQPASNTYRCPEGATLVYISQAISHGQNQFLYRAPMETCKGCAARAKCCAANQGTGRSITRREPLPEVSQFYQRMAIPEMQAIYKQRSEVAEFPNLWLKEKFQMRRFRLRGVAKVKIEALWGCLAYNIRQWARLTTPAEA
jgi:transposase